MNLLLDTHSFIWFINGDRQLSKETEAVIKNRRNKCFLSVASLWEMAIKVSLGKLELKSNFDSILEFMIYNEIDLLPITFEHICRLSELEFIHRDPFDRILICQTQIENLYLVTKDKIIQKYNVRTIS